MQSSAHCFQRIVSQGLSGIHAYTLASIDKETTHNKLQEIFIKRQQ